MGFSLPRGMRDLEPDEFLLMEKVREAFVDTVRLLGFHLMEPSPIEKLSTLEAKSGPAIREEIYHFRDKAGREVGLRFDLTVGLTRYVVSRRDLKMPVKLGAFSGMWRYDEPQYGRYRWFYQWDAEIFGAPSVEADAEVIEFTAALFKRLGLDRVSIELGDRRIVEEYVRRKLGVKDDDMVLEMLRALDKVGKKPVAEVMAEYERKGVKGSLIRKLIEFGGRRGEIKTILPLLEGEGLKASDNLSRLFDALDAKGVKNSDVNLGVVRGLDYYDGIVFEAYDQDNPQLGALAGGGRYDALPALFGRPEMGATGVAGGVERSILALKTRGEQPKRGVGVDVFVAFTSRELAKEAANVASTLRNRGVAADIELLSRSLRHQLRHASSQAIPYVAIVAPREIAAGRVVLRDMGSGAETNILLEDLAKAVKERTAP